MQGRALANPCDYRSKFCGAVPVYSNVQRMDACLSARLPTQVHRGPLAEKTAFAAPTLVFGEACDAEDGLGVMASLHMPVRIIRLLLNESAAPQQYLPAPPITLQKQLQLRVTYCIPIRFGCAMILWAA